MSNDTNTYMSLTMALSPGVSRQLPAASAYLVGSASVNPQALSFGFVDGSLGAWPGGILIESDGTARPYVASSVAQTVTILYTSGGVGLRDNRFAEGPGSLDVDIVGPLPLPVIGSVADGSFNGTPQILMVGGKNYFNGANDAIPVQQGGGVVNTNMRFVPHGGRDSGAVGRIALMDVDGKHVARLGGDAGTLQEMSSVGAAVTVDAHAGGGANFQNIGAAAVITQIISSPILAAGSTIAYRVGGFISCTVAGTAIILVRSMPSATVVGQYLVPMTGGQIFGLGTTLFMSGNIRTLQPADTQLEIAIDKTVGTYEGTVCVSLHFSVIP